MSQNPQVEEEINHKEVTEILKVWLEHYKDRAVEYKLDEKRERLFMVIDDTVGPFEGTIEEWGHMFYLALLPHSSGEKSTIILEHLTMKCRLCNPSYYEQ